MNKNGKQEERLLKRVRRLRAVVTELVEFIFKDVRKALEEDEGQNTNLEFWGVNWPAITQAVSHSQFPRVVVFRPGFCLAMARLLRNFTIYPCLQ